MEKAVTLAGVPKPNSEICFEFPQVIVPAIFIKQAPCGTVEIFGRIIVDLDPPDLPAVLVDGEGVHRQAFGHDRRLEARPPKDVERARIDAERLGRGGRGFAGVDDAARDATFGEEQRRGESRGSGPYDQGPADHTSLAAFSAL